MAKVGLRGLTYAIMDEQGAYGAPSSMGKGITASVSANNADAKLYADDQLAESDSSFISATVSMTVDDDRASVLADLLGHTYNSTSNEIVRNVDDVAPYVGLGRIIRKVVENVPAWKVEFLAKVKFAEPSQEENTKADSVEFGTTTIEGAAYAPENGTWSRSATFATLAEAQAYLTSCFTGESE
jgi:phi13 family phage major tail protein